MQGWKQLLLRQVPCHTPWGLAEHFRPPRPLAASQLAHETGQSRVVTGCPQEQAEEYVEELRTNGLLSTLEPGH